MRCLAELVILALVASGKVNRQNVPSPLAQISSSRNALISFKQLGYLGTGFSSWYVGAFPMSSSLFRLGQLLRGKLGKYTIVKEIQDTVWFAKSVDGNRMRAFNMELVTNTV